MLAIFELSQYPERLFRSSIPAPSCGAPSIARDLQVNKGLSCIGVIGAAIIALAVSMAPAWAQKRMALVIGNSAYQNAPQLPNPARDATSIAKMFKDAGFDSVELELNRGSLDFKRAIRKFEASADQADVAVIYYAGHGIEIGGTNYLIPVDARLASDRDAEDEAVPLERLVSSAEGAKRLRLIILDACRDNPFVASMRRERKGTNRAISAGLGRVEPTTTDTLIAYAAKAGSTAEDGSGEHSPFANAILKDLPVPGLDVRLAFGRVRDNVLKATSNRQEPFVYGSLGGGNVSLVSAPSSPSQEVVGDGVRADYELVQKVGTKRAWEVFLGTHTTGFYADLARAQIDAIGKQEQVASLEPQPPPSGREPSAKDALEWARVKDSTDVAALQKFIQRFPDSPLALNAQRRIETLNRAAQERTEAAEKAKAAAAAAAAQKKREEDERLAAAAEAARKAKEAEAARKTEEAKQKAQKDEREKAAREAAEARAAADRQAQAAEAARKQVEAGAAKEAACNEQQTRLDAILARGSEGTGLDDLENFTKSLTCERLAPLAIAALNRFNAEAGQRGASQPNSPELVRAAQAELVRLGCYRGKPDGTLATTQTALSRYLAIMGLPANNPSVTQDVVSELANRTTRVCPLECKSDEVLKGGRCVAEGKPTEAPSRKERPQQREQAHREKPAQERPRAREEARARPSIVSGGRTGAMIGVGF